MGNDSERDPVGDAEGEGHGEHGHQRGDRFKVIAPVDSPGGFDEHGSDDQQGRSGCGCRYSGGEGPEEEGAEKEQPGEDGDEPGLSSVLDSGG